MSLINTIIKEKADRLRYEEAAAAHQQVSTSGKATKKAGFRGCLFKLAMILFTLYYGLNSVVFGFCLAFNDFLVLFGLIDSEQAYIKAATGVHCFVENVKDLFSGLGTAVIDYAKDFICGNDSLEVDSSIGLYSGEEQLSEELEIAKNRAIKMMQKDEIGLVSKSGKIIDFTKKGFLKMNLSLYSSKELSQKTCIYAIELAIRELAVQEGYDVEEVANEYYQAIRKGSKGSTKYFSGKSDYYNWSNFDKKEVEKRIEEQDGAVVQSNSDFYRLSSGSSPLPNAFCWQNVIDDNKELGQQQHINMVAKSCGGAHARKLARQCGIKYR